MKDDLETIKQVLHKTPPLKTNESAKQHAINLALAKFDEKNLNVSQGTPLMKRLNNTASAVRQFIFGSKPMKNYQYALIGSVCTVFIILAIVPLQSFYTQSLFDTQLPVPELMTEPANNAMQQPVDSAMLKKPSVMKKQLAEVDESIAANDITPDHAMTMMHEPRIAPSVAFNPFENTPSHNKFNANVSNTLKVTKNEPVSTFSIDVDTAAYSYVRSVLNLNTLPTKDAVRVEELINYFPYNYALPTNKSKPFKTNVAVFPTPWNKDTKLLHIGIKGYQLESSTKPSANLVFLVDTSGSMNEPNKLPLLKNALKMLLDTLSNEDTVAIVTYAGNAGVALQPTKVKDKAKMFQLIDNLDAGGNRKFFNFDISILISRHSNISKFDLTCN